MLEDYLYYNITLHLPVCGQNNKCRKAFSLENKEPLSKMMTEFASEIIENVYAENVPTCLPFGNDLNLWAVSFASSPLGRHFLLFCISCWVMAVLLLDKTKNKTNKTKILKSPNHPYLDFCGNFDCSDFLCF